jgi:hypothetical protein
VQGRGRRHQSARLLRRIHSQAQTGLIFNRRTADDTILLLRIAGLFLAVFIAVDGAGAAKPIDTDGPDFVESSEVVGKGRFQFEADVVSERDRRNAARVTTTSTPTLLRFGVTDAIELRVETEGWIRVMNANANAIPRLELNGIRRTATIRLIRLQYRGYCTSRRRPAAVTSGGAASRRHCVR